MRAMVDGESQLVVGTEVTDNASDSGQLVKLVDVWRVREVPGRCWPMPLRQRSSRHSRRAASRGMWLGRARRPELESGVVPGKADGERLSTPEGRAVYAKRNG